MRISPVSSLVALLVLLPGCARRESPGVSPMPGTAGTWPYLGKARVSKAAKAMVVSGSPIASEVGREILQQGGNAVDAAVAVGFALAVVHPEAGNIGGGGFMIIRQRDSSVQALDYRETAPAGATRDMYRAAGEEASVTGHLSVGVPGAVAGLTEAHRRFGRLPLASVIGPAIRLANEGFVVDEYRSSSIGEDSARLVLFPASRATFLPNGRPPIPGTTFNQPELGATLEAIRDSGAAGFYRGWVADLMVAEMKRGGGIITHQDLASYRAIWRDPVTITYRGYTIYSMPPASSGGVTMGEILNIMEAFGPLPPFGSATLMHREAEAMRRAFTDRNTYLGDPGFVHNPVDRLLSKSYAAELRKQIGEEASVTPRFDPSVPAGSSTTHYSVIDADGNAVSCTTTLNNSYGSAVTVTGAGFLLNDEMDDFATSPGEPNMYGLVQGEANAIAPGKRMLSAMTPSIVLDPRKQLYLVVGTPGGPRIITMVYHVISNVIDHRMALPDAVVAPRMHHQGLPDSLQVEAGGFLPQTLDSLRSRGHAVAARGYWGDVEAIIRTPAGWQGVSDPRRGGGGAGY
ncbi:MAG: gamma-glutamyltranspeptidase / glutathione hydrolase [Gemmatimonadales bacterium]|nr:gamma-glutamyltranspeptidase / glutathione hydrolase [Gemmatimonadales bacterium]